jgi:hypothetical protein
MNFYPNPSGITSEETLLALRYLLGLTKNPLFEVISLHGPTWPGSLGLNARVVTCSISLAIIIMREDSE